MTGTDRQDWWDEPGEGPKPEAGALALPAAGGSWFLGLLALASLGSLATVGLDQCLRLAAAGRLSLPGFVADHAFPLGLVLLGLVIGLALPLCGGKCGLPAAFTSLLAGLAFLGFELFLQAGGLQPPLAGLAGSAVAMGAGGRSLVQDFELARLSLYLRSLDTEALLAGGLALVASGLPSLLFSGRERG